MISFLCGFFDTDGSVYRIRYGVQISYTNRSLPLLEDTRYMLKKLRYSPSKESVFKIYLTKKVDLEKFFKEIKPSNEQKLDKMRRW